MTLISKESSVAAVAGQLNCSSAAKSNPATIVRIFLSIQIE
jgi:hypothetical protein